MGTGHRHEFIEPELAVFEHGSLYIHYRCVFAPVQVDTDLEDDIVEEGQRCPYRDHVRFDLESIKRTDLNEPEEVDDDEVIEEVLEEIENNSQLARQYEYNFPDLPRKIDVPIPISMRYYSAKYVRAD